MSYRKFISKTFTVSESLKSVNKQNSCLVEELGHKHSKKKRVDNPNVDQTYSYPHWNEKVRQQWLKKHEKRIVCVLSVSLIAKRADIGADRFKRRDMLVDALDAWTSHGWYPLVFVPMDNYEQYANCLDLESRWKDKVRIVGYNVTPQTCGKSMVVGESRNAILNFVSKFKSIFHTCTIADERIIDFGYGIRDIINLKSVLTDAEKQILDTFRSKFGFKILGIVKDFISTSSDM